MMQCLYQNLPMGYSDDLMHANVFEECAAASSHSLDFETIASCHDDTIKSWLLQVYHSDQTPGEHTFIPWVEVNGKRVVNEELDLLDVIVCKAFIGDGDGNGVIDVCSDLLGGQEEGVASIF
mmetsp:Transcript_8264/g.12348  ORF Transcript_8264/g.12348 Transcript_8264/m.12348 type:complete len:122 (-) Transcript_8264:151-516(-)